MQYMVEEFNGENYRTPILILFNTNQAAGLSASYNLLFVEVIEDESNQGG